jgi:hypothetical protein
MKNVIFLVLVSFGFVTSAAHAETADQKIFAAFRDFAPNVNLTPDENSDQDSVELFRGVTPAKTPCTVTATLKNDTQLIISIKDELDFSVAGSVDYFNKLEVKHGMNSFNVEAQQSWDEVGPMNHMKTYRWNDLTISKKNNEINHVKIESIKGVVKFSGKKSAVECTAQG